MATKKKTHARQRNIAQEIRQAYEDGLEDQADLEHKRIMGIVAGALMGGALGYVMATDPESMQKAFAAAAQGFNGSVSKAVPVDAPPATGPVTSGAAGPVAPEAPSTPTPKPKSRKAARS